VSPGQAATPDAAAWGGDGPSIVQTDGVTGGWPCKLGGGSFPRGVSSGSYSSMMHGLQRCDSLRQRRRRSKISVQHKESLRWDYTLSGAAWGKDAGGRWGWAEDGVDDAALGTEVWPRMMDLGWLSGWANITRRVQRKPEVKVSG
jgi:hypothetical protein